MLELLREDPDGMFPGTRSLAEGSILQDAMGLDTVMYFPSIVWHETSTDDDRNDEENDDEG
jgi:hypothetical protein